MNVRVWMLPFVFAGALMAQGPPKPMDAKWCESPRPPRLGKFERVASADPWFDVYRLDPQTYAIYEPRHMEHVISYLLLGTERALLFDSGFGIGRIDEVVKALTPLPVTVLNSHTHYDHVGGNFAFSGIIAVDSAYTRNHALGTPNDKMSYNVSTGYVCPPLPAGVSTETYSIRPFTIRRTIHDGEKLDLGGRELEILLTPGHTPDSVCVLDRGHRLLLTGDTFYPGSLWLFVPETDLPAYERSMKRLTTFAPLVDRLLPAHTLPEADPKLLGKVVEALADVKAGTAKYEMRGGRRRYQFDGFSMLMPDAPQ
jgi:glyoxylase-like metal-dependent hydrolase (beta-lactamase superfamily II)